MMRSSLNDSPSAEARAQGGPMAMSARVDSEVRTFPYLGSGKGAQV